MTPDGADLDEIASRSGLSPDAFLEVFVQLDIHGRVPRLLAGIRLSLRIAESVPSAEAGHAARRRAGW